MSKPTTKQQKFLDAYAGNATEAARLAGYTGNDQTLAVTGSRLLKNAHIRAHLDARRGLASKPLIADREEVETFLTEVIRNAKDVSLGVKAAAQFAKMRGWNLQKVELTGKVTLEQLINEATKKPEPT